jgi:hypothetical protein
MTTTETISTQLDTSLGLREALDASVRAMKAITEKSVLKSSDVLELVRFVRESQRQRFFPVLHYGVVPWWVGRVAHGRFLAKQKTLGNIVGPNSLTPEKMALRGGFTSVEMDEYVTGWRGTCRTYVETRRDV